MSTTPIKRGHVFSKFFYLPTHLHIVIRLPARPVGIMNLEVFCSDTKTCSYRSEVKTCIMNEILHWLICALILPVSSISTPFWNSVWLQIWWSMNILANSGDWLCESWEKVLNLIIVGRLPSPLLLVSRGQLAGHLGVAFANYSQNWFSSTGEKRRVWKMFWFGTCILIFPGK